MREQISPILSVTNLHVQFKTDMGLLRAVDDVSFDLARATTLGIVGESGSGKTVTGLALMRLIGHAGRTSGTVDFDGTDVLSLSGREMRRLRGRRIAMVFQDPMSALNPFLKLSKQLGEVSQLHLGHSRRQARDHAVEMLELVGFPDASQRIDSYPHELSGGLRQRASIAMAVSCSPELLIADEPTTALDATIQAQILDLIKDLKARTGMSVIMVTHDLGVVAGMADHVVVMYAGKIFEYAPTRELFAAPANPYTIALMKSVPNPAHETGSDLYQIPGMPPNSINPSPGCPFADRCERAEDICRREPPPRVEVSPGHTSLCHFAMDVFASE